MTSTLPPSSTASSPAAPPESTDYYALLNLTPHATAADVGRAFRSRSLSFHPDKQVNASAALAELNAARFQQVQCAYELLSDTTRRQEYDQQRRGQRFLHTAAAQVAASSAARATLWTDVHHANLDYLREQYSYVCKCGHQYTVSEELLDRLLDDEDEELDEIRQSCERCSLGIRIVAGMQ